MLAAAVAACSKKDVVVSAPIKAQQTGQAPTTNPDQAPPTVPPKPPAKADEQADFADLRTATSLELASANAYDSLLSKVPANASSTFNSLVPRLKDHHRRAVGTLQAATRSHLSEVKRGNNRDAFASLTEEQVVYTPGRLKDERGMPDSDGNATFWKTFVEPGLDAISDADGVIAFAQRMENVLTATHVLNTATFTTIDLRHTAMAIGSVEARHAAILATLRSPTEPAVPNALFYTRDATGTADLLTFDGSAAQAAAK